MERELWNMILNLLDRFVQPMQSRKFTFASTDILRVYLWAVLHDRPILWACNKTNWPDDLRPQTLPTPSTMSRRLRRPECEEQLRLLHRKLRRRFKRSIVSLVDGKPFVLPRHTRDSDARVGRGIGGFGKGYKLHAICGSDGHIRNWIVTPLNTNEPKMAAHLLPGAGINGYLLGDANYDTNPLHDQCLKHGVQLIAPRRHGTECGLGHRRHSPGRLRSMQMLEHSITGFGPSLFSLRPNIERLYGNLASASYGLSSLPTWVRRQHRVQLWIAAKILIITLVQTTRRRVA